MVFMSSALSMSTRNLNGKKYKLQIPTDFTLKKYTASEILLKYKKKVADTSSAENLYYSIDFFWPKLKLLYESCKTWKPYQDMLKFLEDKMIQIFPDNQRQEVEDLYKDMNILSRIELKLVRHQNSEIDLQKIKAGRFANLNLIDEFNQLMDAIKTNQQNMTTTKRQREDDKKQLEESFQRTAPILPHGYLKAATSHQAGSGGKNNTNLVVDITKKSPRSGSETITKIWADEQDLGLEFLETLAPKDLFFQEWLKETQTKLLQPDHPDVTFPQKVCYLCSVQTPGI